MKTAATLLLLLAACTGPNPDRQSLTPAGTPGVSLGRPGSPGLPRAKADAADDGSGDVWEGGGGAEVGTEVGTSGGAGGEVGTSDDASAPAPVDAHDGGAPLEPDAGPAPVHCPGAGARFFDRAPPAGITGDCQMQCHRLALCSTHYTGETDLCPCLEENDDVRVESACLEACASAQGTVMLQIMAESRSCFDLVLAFAEAFDPYAASCGARLDP